jgi:hypothetical protein
VEGGERRLPVVVGSAPTGAAAPFHPRCHWQHAAVALAQY